MVRLRPPGLGVEGGPQPRIPIATGPPPGCAVSAGARSELAMDCPRGLLTFFQYGAGTSDAAAAPRVPPPGAAPAPRLLGQSPTSSCEDLYLSNSVFPLDPTIFLDEDFH